MSGGDVGHALHGGNAGAAAACGVAGIGRPTDGSERRRLGEEPAPPGPSSPRQHYDLSAVLHRQGRYQEALAAADDALRLDPDIADGHTARGLNLERLGWLDSALAAFERALEIEPDSARGHLNRGVVLQRQGRLSEARAAYERAVRIEPQYALGHCNLGVVLQRQGQLQQAFEAFGRAARLRPNLPQAQIGRGAILQTWGRADEALAAYDAAVRAAPHLAAAHLNRGAALERLGRSTEAVAAYGEAIRIEPGLAQAYGNRANALADQGRFAEALADYGQALRLAPDHAEAQGNRLFCLHYDPGQSDETVLETHRAWGVWQQRPVGPHENPRQRDKTLRVGLVSSDLGRHPVGYLVMPLLAAADRSEIEFVCYSGRIQDDDLTDRIKSFASGWRSTRDVTTEALAQQVRADGIDILIDLAGHTAGNRLPLFALKPAPVQMSWIGYPYTTGLAAIDYLLMDAATVPPGAERGFVEQVIRLPETRLCYAPPEYAQSCGPPPVLANGRFTFGSFNNLAKVTPEVVRLWARVLEVVPGARLVLKWRSLADRDTRARYAGWFAQHGIHASRLELRAASPHARMLAEYADLDVALDPFPYSGGLTSLEALWQGVPVITLGGGTRPVSRQTCALLRALGRREWIAADPDDYVRIGARLAGDPRFLAEQRRDQRARMAHSPLCDGPHFARRFEAALRAAWHAWCDAGSPSTCRMNLGGSGGARR